MYTCSPVTTSNFQASIIYTNIESTWYEIVLKVGLPSSTF